MMNLLNSMILGSVFLWIAFFQPNTKSVLESPQSNSEPVGDTLINFEQSLVKKIPKTWFLAYTGKGEMCDWQIKNDRENKVMAQLSEQQIDYHFNLVINKSLNLKNVEMQVKLKAVSGKLDQGGGLVWRYQDENNYYVARANPLENNFRVYKVVNGNRIELKSVYLNMNTNQWFSLKIIMLDDRIQCFFNDKIAMTVKDTAITKSGKIGLWTKSDAVTYFDELSILNVSENK